MAELKPIIYPFIGNVQDTRGELHLTVGDFIDRIRSSQVFKLTKKKNSDEIVSFDGIFNYIFCTVKDICVYFLKVHNVDVMNDALTISKKTVNQSNDSDGEPVLYQFKNGLDCLVPARYATSEMSVRIHFLRSFLRSSTLHFLPNNNNDLSYHINVYCFFYQISLIFTGEQSPASFNLKRWITFKPDEAEPSGLIDPIFKPVKIKNTPYIVTKITTDDKTLVMSNNMDAYRMDIRYGISYDIWWFHGRTNTTEILQKWDKMLCNKFAVMHIFHTFKVPHIHVFNNPISLLKYYCNCLYRTYQAQHRFQNCSGITNTDRRGYYGVLLNSRAFDYLFNTFKFNPQCVFGIPMMYSNIVNVPTSVSEFMDMMEYVYENHAKPTFLDLISDKRPFIYKSMYDMLNAVAGQYDFRDILLTEVVQVADPPVTLNNVQDIDVPTVDPIVITEYSYLNSLTSVFPPVFFSCLMNVDNVRTNFNYDHFHYECVIDLDIDDIRVTVDTDEQVFSSFRTNYGITKASREQFDNNIQAKNIGEKYLTQTFTSTMSDMDRLFYSGYVYDYIPNYKIGEGGALDVLGSDVVCDKYNEVNNSTFKLYALFWKFVIAADPTILLQEVSVGYMGAITEPNINILKNISKKNWRVFGIGSDGRGPCMRSNIKSPLGMDSVDYVISDIDLAITQGVDVDACVEYACELFAIVYHMTAVMGIFKIEYCLSKVIYAICRIPDCKYRIVKSVGSRPGSIEVFIIFWKKEPKDRVITLGKAQAIMSLNSLIGQSWKSLNQVQFYDFIKMRGGNPDILSCSLMAYYADEDNIQDLISFVSTFCAFTKVGRFGRDLSNTKSGLVYGLTSLDRLALFTRDFKFFSYTNLLGTPLRLNGSIKADTLKIEGISPITVFTNAQRLQLSNLHMEIMRATDNDFGGVIHDVGCRNFHGVIFGRKYNFEYIGYDTDERLKSPGRNIKVEVKNVVYGDIVNWLQYPSTVVVYNSLFMTYVSNKQLYEDLIKVIEAVKENTCLVVSFYVCDDMTADAVVSHRIGSKRVVNVDGYNQINITFGSYSPVASLTPAQYEQLVTRPYPNRPTVHQMLVSKSDLYYGALSYGRFPNGEADYLLPLLNTVQRSLIITTVPSSSHLVRHSVLVE